MARKYKQVHRKEIDFSLEEWAEVEHRAAACHTKTGTYIKYIAVHGEMKVYDMEKIVPLLNGMRIISNNINQIAKKANETNNIYAGDVEKLREEVSQLFHTLSQNPFTGQSTKA